jgi:sec-independent protein translocase protein TatA
MFGSLGMGELLVILAIVVLIFGVNKIPQLGKGLGEGIRNFKSGLKEGEKEPQDRK